MTAIAVVFVRDWWLIALRGLLAIAFGMLAFAWPRLTIDALVLLFGCYVLLDAAWAFATAIWRSHDDLRGWHVLEGVLGVLAGVVAFTVPAVTATALIVVVGIWAMLAGILRLAFAILIGRPGRWALGIAGVASFAAGVLLVLEPAAGAVALVWLVAASAVVFGTFLFAAGIRLRIAT